MRNEIFVSINIITENIEQSNQFKMCSYKQAPVFVSQIQKFVLLNFG